MKEKKEVAVGRVVAMLRMRRVRRDFMRYLNIKRVENKIYDWIYNLHIAKKFRQQLHAHKIKVT